MLICAAPDEGLPEFRIIQSVASRIYWRAIVGGAAA